MRIPFSVSLRCSLLIIRSSSLTPCFCASEICHSYERLMWSRPLWRRSRCTFLLIRDDIFAWDKGVLGGYWKEIWSRGNRQACCQCSIHMSSSLSSRHVPSESHHSGAGPEVCSRNQDSFTMVQRYWLLPVGDRYSHVPQSCSVSTFLSSLPSIDVLPSL